MNKPIDILLALVEQLGTKLVCEKLHVEPEFVHSWFPITFNNKITKGYEPSAGFIASSIAILTCS